MKRPLKAVAALRFEPYRLNRIYRLAVPGAESEVPRAITFRRLEELPEASVDSGELRDRFGYGGNDAYGYGLFVEGRPAGVWWFWGSRRFQDSQKQ